MCKSKIDKITYSNGSLVQRITLVKMNSCERFIVSLTLSWWKPLSYRNQSIDLQSKSKDWFLYDNGLRHGSVKFSDSMTGSVYFRTLLWIHFKYSQTYFKNLAVFFNIYLTIFQHNAWKFQGPLYWMRKECYHSDFTWDLNHTWN